MSCNRKQRYLQHNNYNMSFIEYFLGIIAPHSCLGCGDEGYLLCSACAAQLPAVPSRCYRCGRITEAFRTCDSCRSQSDVWQAVPATHYESLAKELIHCLKFGRAQAAAHEAATCLVARLPAAGGPYTVVTYVPTAPSRARQRGYDQAGLLAQAVA